MPVEAVLVSGRDGDELHSAHPYNGEHILITANYHEYRGAWKAVSIAAAATTVITDTNIGQAVVVTGFLLSAAKSNGNSVTVQMSDGGNTEALFSVDLTNIDLHVPVTFPYGLRGWEDARLEVVTTGTDPVHITLTYTKLDTADTYAVWDAKR